jgi:hypothetical protein
MSVAIPICPYCEKPAELVNGALIYPHRPDLATLKFWRCAGCNAYTGTHANSPNHAPKGGLAREPLRKARIAAHAAFDGRWRRLGIRRGSAYEWLKGQLGVEYTPHIGFMNEDECARVIAACRE